MGVNDRRFQDKKSPKQSKPFIPVEFINISLSDVQKKEALDYSDWDDLSFDRLIDEIVMQGYKLTITVDASNQCYVISTTGTEDTLNPHKCITSRHDNLNTVIRYALYKIFVVFGNDVWTEQPKRSNFG